MRARAPRIPRYLEVADRLEAAIARRSPGTQLPSENELAQTYEVNRLTARAALEELERRYVVRRAQGRRSVVAQRVDYVIGPHMPASWSETVRMGGAEPRSETETLELRGPSANVRRVLGLRGNGLFLQRKRYVNGELAAVADTWLNPALVPQLAKRLEKDGSLFAVLSRVYRLAPVRGEVRADFIVAPSVIARRLTCEGRPLVMRLEATSISAKTNRVIEMTRAWLRADVFNVVFAMEAAE